MDIPLNKKHGDSFIVVCDSVVPALIAYSLLPHFDDSNFWCLTFAYSLCLLFSDEDDSGLRHLLLDLIHIWDDVTALLDRIQVWVVHGLLARLERIGAAVRANHLWSFITYKKSQRQTVWR